jgi:hypothetical protein
MQQPGRRKQTTSLEERFVEEVKRLRARAESLPARIRCGRAASQVRQAEIAIHVDRWLRSPGLRAPT